MGRGKFCGDLNRGGTIRVQVSGVRFQQDNEKMRQERNDSGRHWLLILVSDLSAGSGFLNPDTWHPKPETPKIY